jgi:hypothetical protein
MGFNSTIVVMNDSLGEIEKDPEFGKKVAAAIAKMSCYEKPVDISSGHSCNAATVIDCHHADSNSIIVVGGNMGEVAVPYAGSYNATEEQMVRRWAEKLGFNLTKKPKARLAKS